MEWNDGAIALLVLMALLPSILFYLLIWKVIQSSPSISAYMKRSKNEQLLVYVIIQFGLVVISIGLDFGFLNLIVIFKGSGLLE